MIHYIAIPYFDKVQITKTRRPVYKTNKKGERVIKNIKSLNKPRYAPINGQYIYSGTWDRRLTNRISKLFKHEIIKHVQDSTFKKLPEDKYMTLELEIHRNSNLENWDLSNRWLYIKWFEDLLKELNIIPDDNVNFIRESGKISYHITTGPELLIYKIQLYDR